MKKIRKPIKLINFNTLVMAVSTHMIQNVGYLGKEISDKNEVSLSVKGCFWVTRYEMQQ